MHRIPFSLDKESCSLNIMQAFVLFPVAGKWELTGQNQNHRGSSFPRGTHLTSEPLTTHEQGLGKNIAVP